jgi:hypothetical protein
MSFSNPIVSRKGEPTAHVRNMDDILAQQPNLKQIHDATTNGVGELRAVPNPNSIDNINLDKVAEKSRVLREKYLKVAKDGDKKAKNPFVTGSEPSKENYDLNVDQDIQKRTKDNIRDESNIERPFDFSKLKSFNKVKANLLMKLKKVESLLKMTKDRNKRGRLHYLQARVTNDIEKMATMDVGKWLNPEPKTEKDPDKDFEKFMKPENTGEQKNTLNDELKRATLNAWSISPKLKKQAIEEFDKQQTQNIEQAITELNKNDEQYKQDIELLEAAIGKKAEVSDEDKEEIKKETDDTDSDDDKDKDKDDKDDDKKTKDKKDDDKKDDKKDKKDDKDDGKKDKKKDLKEKMREMREKRKKGKPKTDEERLETHKEIHPEDGIEDKKDLPPRGTGLGAEAPPKPFMGKDDLTAVFTRTNTKIGSSWEIKDSQDKTILRFNGANAFGKKIFANWDFFKSKEYGKELLARIREDGIEKMADILNAKFEMTKHAEYIEKKAKGTDEDKEKAKKKEKEKKEKEKKQEEEKKAKEKEKEKKEKEKKNEKKAKASPEVTNYWGKYLSKGKGEPSAFKSKIQERVNKTTVQPSAIQKKKSSIKARMKTLLENKGLRKKVAELEQEIEKTNGNNQELEGEKVLRVKAERSLKLAKQMLDKKIIKAEDVEKTVERLTVMDDLSYSMMEGIVGDSDFKEKVSEQIEKKAFKQKAGLRNMLLIPSKDQTLKDKFTGMFMNNPKYAKLQQGLEDFRNKANTKEKN